MKIIVATMLVIGSVFLGFYVGYKFGVTRVENVWLLMELPSKEMMVECFDKQDIKCARSIFEIENMSTKIRVEGILRHGWGVQHEEELREYLTWLEAHQPQT